MEGFFPQVVFYLGSVPIRDTVVSTWVMVALLTAGALVLRWRWPAALDQLVDLLSTAIADVMGRPAEPFLPFLGALALFIAAANVVGVLPILVSPTRDINTPLALALVVFFAVHWHGALEKGLWGHLKSMGSPIFLLPLEIVSQLSRTLSLTLRLFGNVISTELIVAVLFSLLPLIVPVPLMGFGIFTGLLQAYIFTALAAVYIGAAVESVDQ
jgi:F-type H+-transporting ATPase subunit a